MPRPARTGKAAMQPSRSIVRNDDLLLAAIITTYEKGPQPYGAAPFSFAARGAAQFLA
jgi:hypothetical protein